MYLAEGRTPLYYQLVSPALPSFHFRILCSFPEATPSFIVYRLSGIDNLMRHQ